MGTAPMGNNSMEGSQKKIKIELLYDPVVLIPGHICRQTDNSIRYMRHPMLILISFTIGGKGSNQSIH